MWKYFVYALIFLGVILLSVGLIWVMKLPKPSSHRDCRRGSDWVWNSSCLYLNEKFHDPSLKSPKDLSPVLVNFRYSEGSGPSFFRPCWYRFRYVNVKTGGYSDFSSWTKSPVISGGKDLPCPDGKCHFKEGKPSCTFNQPVIGIAEDQVEYSPTQQTSDQSFIYMNLHRYVGDSPTDSEPPPDDVNDEIIGFLLPPQFVGGKKYYTWTDALSNPCKTGCPFPKWCGS